MLTQTFISLKNDFGYTLSREELSKVLRISLSTIDRRIKLGGVGLPPLKRTGKSVKNRVIFPVEGVAKYLECEEYDLEDVS
ncbi:MAG: hypothetical protein L3J44_03850 [Campylobacteraceae bacterium]|nr:hypothetical protein [Campylobacteraceae bacterium]